LSWISNEGPLNRTEGNREKSGAARFEEILIALALQLEFESPPVLAALIAFLKVAEFIAIEAIGAVSEAFKQASRQMWIFPLDLKPLVHCFSFRVFLGE
jgi:hypothetical protein